MNDVSSRQDGPFHAGELQVQERLGVREKIGPFASRVIRDHMPEQHRAFYAQLPFVLVGSVDADGRPWASLLAGPPGFLSTPDDRTLAVAARPLPGDPLRETLRPGADVGVLGIEPATRRRNRLTGRIAVARPDGFEIAVVHSFGNCPQYIQSRDVTLLADDRAASRQARVTRADHLDDRTQALIGRADTLFVATAYTDGGDAPSRGADVSHRGGRPGFVRVDDARSFVFPDFSGNNHFNTIGNLVLNPKAGFLFVDFDSGDRVHLTGEAEIVWDGEELAAFDGAERLVRFRVDRVVRVEDGLPLSFTFSDYSPMLAHTGSWEQARQTMAANRTRNSYADYEVFDIRRESDVITSFYLRRADGAGLAAYEPGQFLPIRLAVPGQAGPVTRTYTVSCAPGAGHYRLSVKREGGDAVASTYLHDQLQVGDRVAAMAPRGRFVLDRNSTRPVVLVSAGVGITPMVAMAESLINEGLRTRQFRRTYFIHGARNGRSHAFGAHLRDLAAVHDSLDLHVRYSDPDPHDRLGQSHDSEGRIDVALLQSLLPLDDYDFYLCGPQAFMQALYGGITALGVDEARIHYESFGPATVLRPAGSAGAAAEGARGDQAVEVTFGASGKSATWTPGSGTLLELAEANGLNPPFACRSGICGTCATRLSCGAVDYLDTPSAPRGSDEVLICCATPRSVTGPDGCGEDAGVVLDL